MVGVGVIGCGYWGPNLIRNFSANPRTELKKCVDLKDDRLKMIQQNYPTVQVSKVYNDIISDASIDLVVVSTPVFTHHELAKEALMAGKHVLLTKPMTSTAAEAEDLVNIATQKNLKIFLDHTFIYTGAVKKMHEAIESGELGEIYYYDSIRINLGLLQQDVNVLWDLAPHDISIMNYLLKSKPESIVATGADHFGQGFEDVAYLTVYFPDNLIAHIHANWLSPVKIRQTLLAGSKKMIVWDDNNPSEKIRIYDKGVDVSNSADEVYKRLIQYRSGDMYCPQIDTTEALTTEINHIVDCLEQDLTPIEDGHAGWNVIRVLEAAQTSIKNRGKEIKL